MLQVGLVFHQQIGDEAPAATVLTEEYDKEKHDTLW